MGKRTKHRSNRDGQPQLRKNPAEQLLRLQAAAVEAAANAVVITDSKGTILWVNRAFTEITGYSAQEAVGQNPRILKSCEHSPDFYYQMWSTIQARHVWRGEIRNRKKDGSLYTEEMTITPVHSGSPGDLNFIAIKQDVTARKQLEAQYHQAQKMEVIGRLAGGVAHDFNNLLNVITGYCDVSFDKLDASHPVLKNLQQIKSRWSARCILDEATSGLHSTTGRLSASYRFERTPSVSRRHVGEARGRRCFDCY